MICSQRRATTSAGRWIGAYVVLGTLLLAVLTAGYVIVGELDYRQLMVSMAALGVAAVVLSGAKGVRWGFLFWICSLVIGYRAMSLTPELTLHPSEVILWGLLLWALAASAFQREKAFDLWLPAWLWCLAPFWIWGWVTGLEAGYAWDRMFSELRNFLLLIPLFYVGGAVLSEKANWRGVVLALYATSTAVATLGLAEYVFPEIRYMFPGYISDPVSKMTSEGFARATFSFWGEAAATYICALAIPAVLPMWKWWPGRMARGATVLAAGLQLAGVYIGGFRILWAMVGVQFFMFLWVHRRYALGGVAALALLGGYQVAPMAVQQRIQSFVLALEGAPVETSGAKHLHRVSDAIEAVGQNPFGLGWSAAGWVHCDFIQVAANLGILAGLLFLGAYVITGVRLARAARVAAGGDRNLRVALLLSFVTAGGLLTTQVVAVLPQLALPVWLVWVLSELFLRQARMERNGYPACAL